MAFKVPYTLTLPALAPQELPEPPPMALTLESALIDSELPFVLMPKPEAEAPEPSSDSDEAA